MTSCGLSQKGQPEKFVASSNGAEYVRCSNRSCGYFCSLGDLSSYEIGVQLEVSGTFTGKDAPLCQHKKPCALRAGHIQRRILAGLSSPVKSVGPAPFFCWAVLELTLRCATPPPADE